MMKRFLLASAACLALSLPAMAQVIPPWSLGKTRILEIQMDLKADGFYPPPVDGFWGPHTREAVIAFQKQQKLPTNGELDRQTLAALGVDVNKWFQTSGSTSKPSANGQDQSRLSSNAHARRWRRVVHRPSLSIVSRALGQLLRIPF
jgi:peptidoglycan hydrolase-like protein with peptidoglycan-binding domain